MTREMMVGLRERFTYRRCASCGSLWLPEPPSDLGRFYAGGYYSMAVGRTPRARTERVRGAILRRAPQGLLARAAGRRGVPRWPYWMSLAGVGLDDRIADVGSGRGALLRTLEACGFRDLWGYDPFLPADVDDGAVHLRAVGASGLPRGHGLVMFHHSLEHTAEPVGELLAGRRALARGGRILVRLPIAGSFADREYGGDWVALDPPRHLTIPSERGMRRIAHRAGLRVVRAFYDSHSLQFWGSELYRRGIPLLDPRSPANASTEVFSTRELRGMGRRARALNAIQDGDSAGFLLAPW